VKLQRRARHILFFGNGDEVAEVAQFHASASITPGYGEARNMVFHKRGQGVAWYSHDEH
jgi:hypothetical protein